MFSLPQKWESFRGLNEKLPNGNPDFFGHELVQMTWSDLLRPHTMGEMFGWIGGRRPPKHAEMQALESNAHGYEKARLRDETSLRRAKVEPERIELCL